MRTKSAIVMVLALWLVGACSGDAKGDEAKAQNAKIKTDLLGLEAACDAYAAQNGGAAPASLEVLVAKDVNGKAFFAAGTLPSDPWGRPYLFEAPQAAGAQPRLFTLGSDGAAGGDGDAHDIDVVMIHQRMERKGK